MSIFVCDLEIANFDSEPETRNPKHGTLNTEL